MNQFTYPFKVSSIRLFLLFLLSLILRNECYSQVNLQTGSATFSLPMFNWQDDKSRLNSVVALSYNSGNGLKVNDIASNVGQGWNLIAGGVITRMPVGEPDDQKEYHTGATESDQDIIKYPAGFLYASTPASQGCPVALTKYPIYGSMNQIYRQHNTVAEDRQLDYFSFQFNGKAGMFVLSKSSDEGISLGDTKMKISFLRDPSMTSQGIRTTITSFTITDVDGLIYKFTKHGLTKVLKAGYCDADQRQEQKQPTFKSGNIYYQKGFDVGAAAYPYINDKMANPYVINSWFLSEIEDALTHRKATFNYVIRNVNNAAGADCSYNADGDYCIVSYRTSITQTPEISSITYPDGHNVVFNYGNDRIDLNGEKALSSVDITYNGRFLSQYKLNTTYFIKNRYGIPFSDYQKSVARLCLKSVQKIGVDLKEDTPPYIFDYYLGSDNPDDFVPPPFFYAKDIWGFYNGNNSVSFDNSESVPLNTTFARLQFKHLKGLCFINNSTSGTYLNAKSGYAKNGLLKQIVYPTGGTLTYSYEQNTGTFMGASSETMVGGVHVSQTSSTDGGYSNGCGTPIATKYNYVLGGAGSASSLWGLEKPVNSMTTSSHYAPEYKSWHWKLGGGIFGECYWHFLYPGILSAEESIDLTGFQKTMNTLAPVLGIISTVTTIIDVINVCLLATPLNIIAVAVDIIGGIVTLAVTCLSNQSRDKTATVYYNTDLNGTSPLPTQFKRVEVVEGPGTIGKTVYEFTNEEDYPIWEPANPTFSAKQRFAPWAYGLPKLTTVFDASGNPTKQTKNVYNFNTQYNVSHCLSTSHYDRNMLLKTSLNIGSVKCVVKRTSSQRNTTWSDRSQYSVPSSFQTTSNSDISVDPYDMYTGRTELDTTYERTFKMNDPSQYVETITSYIYNDENYEVSQVNVAQSDGTRRQKNIFYTIDYVKHHDMCYTLSSSTTTNPEIIKLVQNNIISLPVETNEGIYNSQNYSFKYIYDKATLFSTLANGDIKPSTVLEGRFNQPAFRSAPWPAEFGSLYYEVHSPLLEPANPDYTFYKVAQAFTYDASGNLTGLKDEGSRVVSNIYDYSDKYIVASVINADPLIDKPAYTSFETGILGGWTLGGSSPAYVNSAVTGTRSFDLTAHTLTAPLNSSKPYKLSFWATSAGVAVSSGATLVVSAPAIDGYTYYEYDIAQGTASVSVSGNTTIDELRLYPKTARMRTVTYDPLVGKTSECDENNRITYYEYDNLGRSRFVKDEKGSILKMYEYNNVSAAKQNGCPATYYNRMISETFTRSTCGTGYLGGSVTYTITANKYSSTISQADADAQAENELLTYGQAHADDNGSCTLLYYNTAQSKTVATQICGVGEAGGNVTYSVPAGRYSSIISQADADQKAQVEITANAQAYANDPAYAVCTLTTNPDWTYLENASTYCQSVDGSNHLFVLETDINPNSSSYNQTRWSDVGPQDACPAGAYYSSDYSGYYYAQNCPSGQSPDAVYVSMPAGSYSSLVSQADANNQAQQAAQNYANSYGTCQEPMVELYCDNETYENFDIELANVSTGQWYYFSSSRGNSSIGQVPAGTYNIYINSNYATSSYYFTAGCSFYSYGYNAAFYSVPISSCNTIVIN